MAALTAASCPAAVTAEQALMATFLPAAAAAPPPRMTAEGAVRQAGAEGLTLLRSDKGSGYKGVSLHKRYLCVSKPYQAKVQRGGKRVHLGCFATAEEAALSYARAAPPAPPPMTAKKAVRQAAAAPPAPPPMTAEEAVRQANAEGLTLLKAKNTAGYKGVRPS